MRAVQKLWIVVGLVALTAPVWAQAQVTSADITRLETTATEIERNATALKKTDATLAADVEKQLVELRDEITYLKVKLRREAVTREEYSSLRDKLETLRVKAAGQKVAAQPVLEDPTGRVYNVPVGTELDARLQTGLNSGTAKVEQRFEATTLVDYSVGDRVVIPAGSLVRGFVSSVRAAGKIDRRGSITLSFDELRIESRSYRLRASVVSAIDPKMADDYKRVGAGAVVGGIIGGILGGGKGALLGVLVGGGGTMAATEGADVDLPVGTVLRIRVDQSIDIAR